MVQKRRKLILVLICAIAVVLTVLVINALVSYIETNSILEKGIKITLFTAENKSEISSYFDITADDTLEFVSLEYISGLKDTSIELQIKFKDKTKINEILSNYLISKDVYSSLGFEAKFSDEYELSEEQYVNLQNSNKRALIVANGEDCILLLLSDRTTDNSIREYAYNQVKLKNFEKLN